MRVSRSIALLGTALLLSACGDDAVTPEASPPVVAQQSGDMQTADAGATLAAPVVVRVSQDGAALAGATVNWTVTAGGGSATPTASTTGADGTASTSWTLGAAAGENTLQATVSGATGSPISFTATGESVMLPMQAAVTIGDNFFNPDATSLAVGGTVTWTWGGAVGHNVTFSSGPNSTTQAAGTFARTFSDAGSFDYMCTIHGSSMSGVITVQ